MTKTYGTLGIGLACAFWALGCGKTVANQDMGGGGDQDLRMTTDSDLKMDDKDLKVDNDLKADVDMKVDPDMRMGIDMKPQDCTGVPSKTVTINVGMGGNNFDPKMQTIIRCDKVRWVWVAGNHNVVSGSGGTPDNWFCSDPTMAGNCATSAVKSPPNSYEFQFTVKGTYPYYCRPHLGAGMTGTIVVN